MRVELYRPAPAPPVDQADASAPPPSLVGSASWVDGEPVVDCDDEGLRALVARAYRKTPVVTDDASYRQFGTHGDVQIQPGSLEWFRAASFVRVPAETGLEVRLVPGITEGGFDPAAGYRTFQDSIERLSSGQ